MMRRTKARVGLLGAVAAGQALAAGVLLCVPEHVAAVLSTVSASVPTCDDVLPASPVTSAIETVALLTPACQGSFECVNAWCTHRDPLRHPVAQYVGSFMCSGKQEAIVVLARCGSTRASHMALLQATEKGWRRAALLAVDPGPLPTSCRVEKAAARDILLCEVPSRSASICAAFRRSGAFTYSCPVRAPEADMWCGKRKPDVRLPWEVDPVSVIDSGSPARLAVAVGGHRTVLLLDDQGFRLSPEAKESLRQHPIEGATVRGEVLEPTFSLSEWSRLCDRVADIKVMPFKGEPVDDDAYNELKNAGCKVVDCLAGRIGDTTPTTDPTQSPGHVGITVTVGDVAMFVLEDITGHSYEEELPAGVRAKVPEQGVYAYYRFVKDPKNRKLIRNHWVRWLEESKVCKDQP